VNFRTTPVKGAGLSKIGSWKKFRFCKKVVLSLTAQFLWWFQIEEWVYLDD
jgi:hypothetical protein